MTIRKSDAPVAPIVSLNINTYFPVLSPAQVNANTTAEQTFTVNGLKAVNADGSTADLVFVNKPTAQAGLGIVGARVPADNQIAITFSNNTGAGITPTASETYRVLAMRHSN